MELNILHTNDIHSHYDNYSKLITLMNKLRNEASIVLDAGDFFDFDIMDDHSISLDTSIELLEQGRYDAIAVGNNETFRGIKILESITTRSKVPYLSCNLLNTNFSRIKGVKRSIILNKNNLKILVIGASPELGNIDASIDFKNKNYLKAIEEELERNRDRYDICILLSHLGMDKDRIIAREFSDIDIILGGHFHLLMDKPEIIKDTAIHSSGDYAENIGCIKIDVKDQKCNILSVKNIPVIKENGAEV